MIKSLSVLIPFVLSLLLSFTSAYSQSTKIDSLSILVDSSPDSTKIVLYLQIAQEYLDNNFDSALLYTNKSWYKRIEVINEKNAEMEVRFETVNKEAELENAALENKLQEQQLNEANFQLIVILFISIITAAFVITYYFLRSKRAIAERKGQELQVEALIKRLLEHQLKHEGIEKTIDIAKINQELGTPLTEREIEALHLSLEGFPNNEIAEKLTISVDMVKIYLQKTHQKLGINGKMDVINYV